MSSSPRTAGRFAGVWLAVLTAGMVLGLGETATAAVILRNVNVTLNAANIESYNLDVDRNGTTDFTFTAAFVPDPVVSVGFDVVDFPFGGNNGVVIDPRIAFDGFPTASRLRLGDAVSAANTFSIAGFEQGNLFFYVSTDTPPPSGNFGGRTGYVGLRFDAADGTHFGFAQVTVKGLNDPTHPFDLTIGTVGYETVPGRPLNIIAIPEPASLLAVAGLGGAVLIARVRRRAAHAVPFGKTAISEPAASTTESGARPVRSPHAGPYSAAQSTSMRCAVTGYTSHSGWFTS